MGLKLVRALRQAAPCSTETRQCLDISDNDHYAAFVPLQDPCAMHFRRAYASEFPARIAYRSNRRRTSCRACFGGPCRRMNKKKLECGILTVLMMRYWSQASTRQDSGGTWMRMTRESRTSETTLNMSVPITITTYVTLPTWSLSCGKRTILMMSQTLIIGARTCGRGYFWLS